MTHIINILNSQNRQMGTIRTPTLNSNHKKPQNKKLNVWRTFKDPPHWRRDAIKVSKHLSCLVSNLVFVGH